MLDYHLATPADDADLRQMLRESPFPGRIRVTFEREPNFFLAGPIEGDIHQTIVARETETGNVAGILSRAVREVYVNGQVAPLGYISQMRVAPKYRASPRANIKMGEAIEQ